MKTNDSKGKLFRQLSDEELEKVTGGLKSKFEWGVPEECKDEQYMCSHPQECHMTCLLD